MPKLPDLAADNLAAFLAGRRDLKRIERSNTGKVLRRFAKLALPMGYHRKSTLFAREAGHIIQFLHLHKFSFGPHFRMHVCIRVLNDSSDTVALNGTHNGETENCRGQLAFEDSDASVTACAWQIAAFVSEIAEPWFSRWNEQALAGTDSPLYPDERNALRQALAGNADPANILRSKTLLGLA